MSNILSPTCFIGNDAAGNVGLPWNDLQGDISLGDAVANPTYEALRDTPFKLYWFRHDQNDVMHFRFQTNHSWDPTTSLKFHLHVIPGADPVSTQNIRFAGQYAWAPVGSAVPANTSWTPFTADLSVAPGDVNKHSIVPVFTAAPPAGALESAFLLVYLYRDSGTSDTYTTSKGYGTSQANVALLGADCHYQSQKDGTATEIPA